MNSKAYRWCAVRECDNTSIKTPNKLFVFVPQKKTIRTEWLRLARRDSTMILPGTHLYFCEDHFDLPNDMENYMEYHVMGLVSQVHLKPGCMPSKFQHLLDRRKQPSDDMQKPHIAQKQIKTLIEKCQKDLAVRTDTTKQMKFGETLSGTSVSKTTDDIDIEEHDVMDDPKIKLIFPDLSKLKKEILEPYDEEPKDEKMQEMLNEHGLRLADMSLKSQPGHIKELVKIQNHKDVVEISQIAPMQNQCKKESENIPFFRNKIILGSKPSRDKEDVTVNFKVKIVIKSIDLYLEKSKRYCNICSILFSSKQTLEEHIKVWHSPYQDVHNVENNTEVNSLVQNNSKRNQCETNVPEKCFHCNTEFLTQKSLIDHLYDVLESKHVETKNVPDNVPVNEENCISIQKTIKIHDSSGNNATVNNSINCSSEVIYVYQCQVCSYYFNQEKFYQLHILKKHKMKKASYLPKVKFNSKCAFCCYEYTNVQFYNAHLLKGHRDIVHRKVLSNKNYRKDKNVLSDDTCFANYSENNDQLQTNLRKDTFSCDSGTNVLILKSIVFKCCTCNIHFLSSAVAIDHLEHSQILINWKCSICSKIFKRNDEELHIRQHQCSTSFTVYELCETDFDKVMYKCSLCAVHFMEQDIMRHLSYCDEEPVRSAYCSLCDILVDYKIKLSHEKSHSVKNMTPADFIVVNSNKTTFSSSNENNSKNKIQPNDLDYITQCQNVKNPKKANAFDTNPKPSDVKLTKKKVIDDLDSDTYFNPVSVSTKRFKTDEMYIDSNYSSNDSDINSKMDVGDDSNSDSDFKTYSSSNKCKGKNSAATGTNTSDSDTNNYSDPKGSKIVFFERSKKRSKKTKVYKKTGGDFDSKSLSKRFSYKNINQLQLLNLTYCNFCECFVSRTYKRNVHLQSLCTQILKRVCTYCGLTITAKCTTAHKAFHKLNPHLTLQDFKFYDIKTNKIMCPPIPILPKCDICDKCFTSKVDIIGHICTEVDYVQCSICNIKLSEVAYKLHVPFHNYSLNNIESKKSDFTSIKNCSKQVRNDSGSNISSLQVYNSGSSCNISECFSRHVFLCKSCNLAFNTYDDAIEHCQSHYLSEETIRNSELCKICNLKFESDVYKYHQELHSESNKEDSFRIISFDVFYFGSSNEEWFKHVFQSLSTEEKDGILQKSIYNFESRVKMKIEQPGPWNLTVYLCDKCRCFLDNISIFKHVASCNGKSYKNPCTFCGICFVSSLARTEHEQNVHKQPGIVYKSYRIVMFNSKEDKILNDAIANTYNRYVLYKCRNCSGVVDENHQNHKCQAENLKKCAKCGLLFNKKYYDLHISKHNTFDSFMENNMKVILFGCKSKDKQNQRTDIVCSFSGIVYDYTFYKCVKCEVCVRYLRPSSKHFCLIDAAKLKCSKCQLYFDEGKMKGHLKQHSCDPDFSRDNMMVVEFHPEETTDREDKSKLKGDSLNDCEQFKVKNNNNITNSVKNNISTKSDTIYKCPCGLHHLTKSNGHGRQKCVGKKNILRQTCSKCGLAFTPNVLFKHLLKHHGDKTVLYKLEIIEI